MKIKNRVGLAFSLVLLSASIATAQAKPTDLPNPTISTQQQDQLEKLQQEKEIRDRVQSEVESGFWS